ncbi:MAG: hypothetical protein ABW160_18910 [Candidatus Thiodiazotropha sp. 4PDIV1]
MRKPATTKAVTTRFSLSEYEKLAEAAEKCSGTVADVIRDAWHHYQQRQHIEQQLLQLEQRLKHSTFESLLAITNLDDDARENALQKLRDKGVNF